MSLLNSVAEAPRIRERLHSICALYAHARPERRLDLLEHLERLTLETAALLANEMLEAGWRPHAPSSREATAWGFGLQDPAPCSGGPPRLIGSVRNTA